MSNQLLMGSFYIIKCTNSSTRDLHNFYKIENFIPEDKTEWQKENIVLYDTETTFNTDKLYSFELFQLPFTARKSFTHLFSKDNFTKSAYDLFSEYCKIATITNNILSNKYTDVYVFCSLLYNDYCVLIPKELSHNFDAIKNEAIKSLIDSCFSLHNSPDLSHNNAIIEADLADKKQKRLGCIHSGRKFVKHSSHFHLYEELIDSLDSIQCDSLDRKQELSLFSSLIITDLIHIISAYWMRPTGDFHYALAEKTYSINKQEQLYFYLFSLFCKQTEDNNKYNDWCWVLTFLTQTLLSTINGRSKFDLQQEECDKYFNFFGFAPILLDLKEHGNEVTSLYTHHSSAKFCHGFLIVPKSSVYNIIANLPAYIHEFFHYIPPKDRTNRNKAVLELLLHSVFFNLRNQLTKISYTCFFNLIENEVKLSIEDLGLTNNDFFAVDSMEFINLLKILFNYYSFEDIYKDAMLKTTATFDLQLLLANKDACVNKFNDCAYDYFNILVLFFREIRSDIEMCKFLDIDLKQYIKFMAEEPEFCILPKEQVGDSTIMRFGYMCHYLYFIKQKKLAESEGRHLDIYKGFRIADWFENVTIIIKELQQDIKNLDFKQKYENLQGYLQEYMDLAIEQYYTGDSDADRSVLESTVCKIFDPDKYPSIDFKQYKFTRLLKDLFDKYMSFDKAEDEEKKLQLICGIKILFRDLYAFDPDLDLQT
ncbi:MAG: hypothetical protein IJA31_08390 [Clostridia bacterium]|nr:hypothetical protein [Clostridia bacterium]MBQ4630814.1 hypothetical protein [Clostridia bacterium]MBQ6863654.1 hypothetical protein [Clostridia bacterium]